MRGMRITIYELFGGSAVSNAAFKVPEGTGYMPWRVVVSNPVGPTPLPPPFHASRVAEPADPNGVEPLAPASTREVLEYGPDRTKPAIVVPIR
jgi:hypothetical protein